MDTTRNALIYNLSKTQSAVAEALVPWFTANMPASYFRTVNNPELHVIPLSIAMFLMMLSTSSPRLPITCLLR